jgi:hypothetical protein
MNARVGWGFSEYVSAALLFSDEVESRLKGRKRGYERSGEVNWKQRMRKVESATGMQDMRDAYQERLHRRCKEQRAGRESSMCDQTILPRDYPATVAVMRGNKKWWRVSIPHCISSFLRVAALHFQATVLPFSVLLVSLPPRSLSLGPVRAK